MIQTILFIISFLTVEQPQKYVIGLELRTSNAEAHLTIPAHWSAFYEQNVCALIPNKVNNDLYGLYTDYESDFTKPYSLVIGYEVSTLEQIPAGLVGKVIPAAKFTIVPAETLTPDGVLNAWKTVWSSTWDRTYNCDYELYKQDQADVYIGIR